MALLGFDLTTFGLEAERANHVAMLPPVRSGVSPDSFTNNLVNGSIILIFLDFQVNIIPSAGDTVAERLVAKKTIKA